LPLFPNPSKKGQNPEVRSLHEKQKSELKAEFRSQNPEARIKGNLLKWFQPYYSGS
jgi:hypothetical protein